MVASRTRRIIVRGLCITHAHAGPERVLTYPGVAT